MSEQDKALARKNTITALVLAAVAAGFFILFFIVQSHRA